MCEGNIIYLPYNARTRWHEHDTELINIETENGKAKMKITHSADTVQFSMYPNLIHLKPGHTLTFGLRITYTRILSVSFRTMNSSFKWTYNTESYEVQILLQWRHNGRDSVSNHQPHDCFLNRLFRRRSKKTSRLRVNGLCAANSPGTGEFPAQMASNAENVSI